MIVTVLSFKGGVGKTTTAIHLAAFLNKDKQTLLVDGDGNRSASLWGKRGKFPFTVVDHHSATKYAKKFDHIVIDTYARPNLEDLEGMVEGCDYLVLPTTPESMALDALVFTVASLKKLKAENYRILLTMIPPKPSKDGEECRALLEEKSYPLFKSGISRLTAFQKASANGVTVNEVKDERAQRGWQEYIAVGKEILRYGKSL
jgi:chromosome partitioning protein